MSFRPLAPGDLLTPQQVLAIMPVGKSTLYRLLEAGEIPCHRVRAAGSRRGRLLVHRADLEAFLTKTRQTRQTRHTPAVRVDVDSLLEKMRRGSG